MIKLAALCLCLQLAVGVHVRRVDEYEADEYDGDEEPSQQLDHFSQVDAEGQAKKLPWSKLAGLFKKGAKAAKKLKDSDVELVDLDALGDGLKGGKDAINGQDVWKVLAGIGAVLQCFPATAVLGTVISAVAGVFVESDADVTHRLLGEMKKQITDEADKTREKISQQTEILTMSHTLKLLKSDLDEIDRQLEQFGSFSLPGGGFPHEKVYNNWLNPGIGGKVTYDWTKL